MMDNNLPERITCEMIRDLKNKGLQYQANKMLRAFHDDKEKNKKQIIREIHNKYVRKRKFLLKKEGLCIFCSKPSPDRTYCDVCKKKYYSRKK